MTKRSIARLCALGLVVAGMLTQPITVSAKTTKPGCYGASCNGRDPQSMGCAADARTLSTKTGAGVRVELRYSNRCHARWARTSLFLDYYYPDMRLYAYVGSGNITFRTANAKSVWSYMWASPIRACGGIAYDGPAHEICTLAK